MKIEIEFVTPDGSLITDGNTVIIDEVTIRPDPEALENLVRGIAHGYGIPRAWEVEKVQAFATSHLALVQEVRAIVYFRKVVFGEITIRLAGLLRQVAYALHDSTVKHDPATIVKHNKLYAEAVDYLNQINL